MSTKFTHLSLIISISLHLVLAGLFFYSYQETYIPSHFVVFGAHSKKQTHAYYKSIPIPPVHAPATTHNTIKDKQSIQKQIPKKSKTVAVKETKKKKNAIKSPAKKSVKKETPAKKITPPTPTGAQSSTRKKNKKNLIQISMNKRYQNKMAHYQKLIQQEVIRVWRPPVGISKGTECYVLITVNKRGIVENCEVKKSSDMLLYDLSIIQASQQFKFAKNLWGKQFIIEFRQ